MATYAIGDIQGCYNEFMHLLDLLKFDPSSDKLWIAGDMVNRGPESLAVLEKIMSLKQAAVVVLGNHELHLLALSKNPESKPGKNDTIEDVLSSPRLKEITTWLCDKALFHYDPKLRFAMVHAGLPPQWSIASALKYSNELSITLSDEVNGKKFLKSMYGNEPSIWKDNLKGMERLKFIADCLTRCRYFSSLGYLDFMEKKDPSQADVNLRPWYLIPEARWGGTPIVFGHWASLTLTQNDSEKYQVFPIDTGAVWGGKLTAMRLEDKRFFSVDAKAT